VTYRSVESEIGGQQGVNEGGVGRGVGGCVEGVESWTFGFIGRCVESRATPILWLRGGDTAARWRSNIDFGERTKYCEAKPMGWLTPLGGWSIC